MTRLLAVPLDASDVFKMTFMILQDSYMEPTRVGSDMDSTENRPNQNKRLIVCFGSADFQYLWQGCTFGIHYQLIGNSKGASLPKICTGVEYSSGY